MQKNSNFIIHQRVASFLWQHLLLCLSLFLMTIGVALCVRSQLGSSVISSLPLVFSLAGADRMAPRLTIGEYTQIMNIILIIGQILVLRRRFKLVQLAQVLVGFVFGWLIDLSMLLTDSLACNTLLEKSITQFAGCTIMSIGIAFEVRCGSVTMPGEGFPVALSKVTGLPFAKLKIIVDCTLVALAVCFCYIFYEKWLWNVIGGGTLFAMLYVGWVVKLLSRHLCWFDSLLTRRPGFHRVVYGLAQRLFRNNH